MSTVISGLLGGVLGAALGILFRMPKWLSALLGGLTRAALLKAEGLA